MARGINQWLARFSALAALLYAAVIVGLVAVTWLAAADIHDRRQAVAEAQALAAQLERGRPAAGAPLDASVEAPPGSPFLEGQTVTLAGAALLARVAGAVTRANGSVLSSQVDVQDAAANAGRVSLVASCELSQPDLQRLLYDLEAGMPYLFVDQLTVQAPETVTRGEGGRLRVVLGASGQWQGAR